MAEVSLVLTAEVGGAIITDHVASFSDVLAFLEEYVRPVQFYGFGVLQRRDVHDVFEVFVEESFLP